VAPVTVEVAAALGLNATNVGKSGTLLAIAPRVETTTPTEEIVATAAAAPDQPVIHAAVCERQPTRISSFMSFWFTD
jgi:hypothetical protein